MTATLIPRTRLFGNPTRAQGQISPDGRWLSWLAPKDGVLNIWVAPAADMRAARVLTDDKKRGIRFHAWANSSAHVLYIQDEGGTEDWHVFAVPVEGGTARDLTPLPGVNARIQELSLDEPHVLAVGLNDRDKAWHDIYRIDIRSGERELLYENRNELAGRGRDRRPHPRRQQVDRRRRRRRGAHHLSPLRPRQRQHHRAVRHPAGAEGLSARCHASRGHQRARRPGAGVVPDAAGRRLASSQGASADGARWCTADRGRATSAASIPQHQWLANRGYAVLSRQLPRLDRLRQGVRQRRQPRMGRKMHDDLLDAVAWAVEQGIADPDKVAIMGGSYGGYATLVGLTFTPDVFCCGVDIVGPSNLVTLLATIPPYWAAFFENLARRASAIPAPRRAASCCRSARRCIPPATYRQAAADRSGRQRPARQAGRSRPDRRRHARQGPAGHLRALSRRRPRLRACRRTACPSTPSPRRSWPQHLGGRAEPIGAGLRRRQVRGGRGRLPRARPGGGRCLAAARTCIGSVALPPRRHQDVAT